MSAILEATVHKLIDRIRAADEDSAEYAALTRQLGELLNSNPDAQLIAEEYQSLLDTID